MRAAKCLFFILLPCILVAQVPFTFNYQGVARDGQGDPLSSQSISLLISIVKGSQDGIIEFSEQHFVTTAENGLFSLKIGKGEFISGNLRNIDWSEDDFFIRTEMDAQGGENYMELGTSQMYAVPYALFALKAGNSQSGGGSGEDDQTLTLNGTILTIENGNSVNLASLQDGVNDEDSDPFNEIQTLSLTGSQLTISDGNSVTLPTGSDGENGDSPWQKIDENRINFDGEVQIGSDPNDPVVGLGKNDNESGRIVLTNQNADIKDDEVYAHGEFGFYGFDKDEQLAYWLGTDDNTGHGFLDLRNGGNNGVLLEVASETGRATTYGPNGNRNVSMNNLDGAPNNGFMSLADEQGTIKSALYVADNQAGRGYLNGPNGNRNIGLNNLAANTNHGYISVADSEGENQAGLYVDASGQGVIFADVKNFRTPHPTQDQHEIVYASLEGPEAAAYLRGTGTLQDGATQIDFPEHFQHIISPTTMTVILTPLSADSKGLSVVEKGEKGFYVQELWQGRGNYAFDWEVKAIRSGFEDYQVIRKKEQNRSADTLYQEKDRPLSPSQIQPQKIEKLKN